MSGGRRGVCTRRAHSQFGRRHPGHLRARAAVLSAPEGVVDLGPHALRVRVSVGPGQDSFEGRLFTWGWSMQVFGVFAAWVLFTKAYREHRAKAEKRRRRPLLRAERVQAMNDLEALRDQCITICVQGEIPLVD